VFEHFGQAPDGSTPEFNDDYRTIWLVHADGTGLHELAPGKPSDGKSSPDISPDGKNVIFSSWLPTSSLYEVPISGGDPRKLATPCPAAACAASDPAYSADGSKIAFIRREPGSKSTTSVVVVLDRASGTLTVLEGTRVNETEAFLTQPSWSPDGTRIVYTRNIQTATDEHITDARLFVANIDGSATLALPQPADAPGPWAADADWSPDGSSIVFSTKPNRESEGWGGPSPSIYTVAPDGSNLKPVCTSCLDGGIAPSWTPDGKHILFWGFRSWALMDPDGSEMAHINQAKLTWFGGTLGFGYAAFLQPTP